jgi:hypothetical protein
MQFKCYRMKEYRLIDRSEFAVFKAAQKWVVGILPNGDEWLMPSGLTLKEIELNTPDLVRVNRFVLVARQHIIGVSTVLRRKALQTVAGTYLLSRRMRSERFVMIARQNAIGRYEDSAADGNLNIPEASQNLQNQGVNNATKPSF